MYLTLKNRLSQLILRKNQEDDQNLNLQQRFKPTNKLEITKSQ